MLRFLFYAAAVFSLTSVAHADPGRYTGMLCNTTQAIKSAFAIHDSDPTTPLDKVISTVNAAIPDSCGTASVFGDRGETVKTITSDGAHVDIMRFSIKAFCQGGRCLSSDPMEMFIGLGHYERDSI